MFKKSLVILVSLLLLFSLPAFAEDDWLETQETEDVFTDVNKGDWHYKAVMTMHKYGIIAGYKEADGSFTFRPENSVSREEFATMMVNALKLEILTPESTFVDVADGYWASKYIETAKPYLTGYKSSDGLKFKPSEVAVREDMAVALVRALDKPVTDDLSALEGFEDAGEINDNLKAYMASAISNNLMSGLEEDGKKYIHPLRTLTRAEAAALLLKVVQEEKIVFDEKVVLEESDLILNADVVEGGMKLSWQYKGNLEAKGFKVVASKEKTSPAYPESGSAKYVQANTTTVYNNDPYFDGDFTSFKAGETYYFTITALVGDQYVTSNVIQKTMPAAVSIEGKVPEVKVSKADKGLVVQWQALDTKGLQGYKVVASKTDETPVYPENGYAKWITNLDTLSYYIEPGTFYSGGDIGGKFKPGETYYFSVTAVYDSGKIAGNTVKFVMPGEPEPVVTVTEKTPKVQASIVDGKLIIEWNEINTEGLQGYKIVASKANQNPVYPDAGYAYWLTDLTTRSKVITPGTKYNGGDLEGAFKSGQTYYVSVTAVYGDLKIPGNAVKIIMP